MKFIHVRIHSNMLIWCSIIFLLLLLLLSMLKIVVLLNIFVETMIVYFSFFFLKQSLKEHRLFRIEMNKIYFSIFS